MLLCAHLLHCRSSPCVSSVEVVRGRVASIRHTLVCKSAQASGKVRASEAVVAAACDLLSVCLFVLCMHVCVCGSAVVMECNAAFSCAPPLVSSEHTAQRDGRKGGNDRHILERQLDGLLCLRA